MRLTSPHHWPTVPFHQLHRLPKSPGLYAVCGGVWPKRKILYIGRSKNIHRRWNSSGARRHHRYWQASLVSFCSVGYLETERHEQLEDSYIDRYDPPWNWSSKPLWWSQDNALLGRTGVIIGPAIRRAQRLYRQLPWWGQFWMGFVCLWGVAMGVKFLWQLVLGAG